MSRTALVVSGGGAKGAYAVGVLNYLWDQGVNRFDVYAGTSTGALIAPLALAGQRDVLNERYTSSRMPDFFAPQSLAEILGGRSLLRSDAFRATLEQVVTDEVVARVFGPNAPQLIQTAVHLRSGDLVYFHSGAAPAKNLWPARTYWITYDPNGQVALREQLIRVMQASGSEPVIMPPVAVYPGQSRKLEDFIDGGVRVNAPMAATMAAGATLVVAILLSPPTPAVVPEEEVATTPGILFQVLDIFINSVVARDLDEATAMRRLNPAIDLFVVRPQTQLIGVSTGPDPTAMSLMRERGYDDARQQLAPLLGSPTLRGQLIGQPPVV
jgi:predicted acylesterase/phospholipase RssA